MRTFQVASVACALALANACASTGPDLPAVWGSDQVSLTSGESGTSLQILASGGCYGSYGTIAQPIPSGTFTLIGSYTQLTGVYPGSVQYQAQYDGTLEGHQLTLTIHILGQQTLGPFSLTYGVAKTWQACRYP